MAGAQDSSAGAENGRPAHSAVSLRTKGLEKSVVESLPVVHFKDLNFQDKMDHGKKTEDGGDGENEEVEPHRECAVCLSEFEAEDSLRLLPKCKHIFHLECIDVWFQSHSTCPLCRAAIVQEDDHGQQVHDDERERHRSIVIHEEQEHEGEESEEAHEAALQSPHDFVVTIDRGDAGEESARETQGLQQPAVLLLARTRSGISATEGKKILERRRNYLDDLCFCFRVLDTMSCRKGFFFLAEIRVLLLILDLRLDLQEVFPLITIL